MSITFTDFLRHGLNFDAATNHPSRIVKLMQLAWRVRRERNQLADLSREQLVDMGIHHGDAKLETTRGLFDLPKSRLEDL